MPKRLTSLKLIKQRPSKIWKQIKLRQLMNWKQSKNRP